MLKISKLADYAVNVAIQIVKNPESTHSATNISVLTGLQLPTVRKVMKLLARVGLLSATRGFHGGYCLSVKAEDLTLADVIEAVDGPIAILDCVESDNYSCHLPNCAMRPKWEVVNRAIYKTLSEIKISTLMHQNTNEVYISLEEITNV